MWIKTAAIVAAVAAGGAGLAMSRQTNGYKFAIAPGSNGTIWRLNTGTGALSMCLNADLSKVPVCSPWGERPYAQYIATDGRPISQDELNKSARLALEELYQKGVLERPKQ